MSKPRTTIGITIGDINGIGIETIIKTFTDNRILSHCTPVIYGSSKAISYHRKALNISNFNYNIIKSLDRLNPKSVNIFNCWEEEVPITMGEASDIAGEYAYIALDFAANDLKTGKIDALVTAPVHKGSMQTNTKQFTGHTEFLTEYFGVEESLMMMISDDLRIGLATNHVSLKDVGGKIKQQRLINKLNIFHESLIKDFGKDNPTIAVLGLNPHAGDEGLLGKEEKEEITPAIEAVQADNKLVFGPFPADGFFGAGHFKKFDGVLAMYHDQGLVGFKALSFGGGVNFTAGLPVIRTSPDHGTGFEIAGQNKASESSLRSAIFAAIDIYRQRSRYFESRKNPLQKMALREETV